MHDNLETSGCLPLVISWIYQRFPRFCPPGRDLMVFPLVSRLSGLGQISRDTHTRRMLDFRNELDRVGIDDRAIEPDWVNEVGEVETWLAAVPIVLFMYVRFHHVDRVKRQFGSEQAVPLDPVNLDGFDRASARGDDKWWPTELAYWYEFWCNRRCPEHQIQIVATHYPGWPTQDDHSGKGADSPTARCPRRGRRARMQRPDIRRKGEGTSTSGRSDAQPGRDETRRLSTIVRRTFPPRSRGDGDAPHKSDLDFFFGADIELARIILQGEGFGAGTVPQASGAGPSFNRFGPPNEKYDVFSCGEQMMDHIAHDYRASCIAEDTVYRSGPPLQPHHDPEEQCQGFQYYQPSQQSYIQPSPQQHY
ncbi:hypothetical protein PIB30_066649 [Stylosanthes scabra]|uniref:Aminotransferase-like plant mobile domain-containing protein n=1 Tax=Stylosanthes scabra TaxID=79078 RepID=A0ABU6QMU9_9FABA|nr:hypothetical protein [Stylosanthes scabra]